MRFSCYSIPQLVRLGPPILVAILLGGCVSLIRDLPSQNVLMFNGDGVAVDPTGNLNCPEGGPVTSRLCNETEHLLRDRHLNTRGHPELASKYYEEQYLRSVFECIEEYSRDAARGSAARSLPWTGGTASPDHGARSAS